ARVPGPVGAHHVHKLAIRHPMVTSLKTRTSTERNATGREDTFRISRSDGSYTPDHNCEPNCTTDLSTSEEPRSAAFTAAGITAVLWGCKGRPGRLQVLSGTMFGRCSSTCCCCSSAFSVRLCATARRSSLRI